MLKGVVKFPFRVVRGAIRRFTGGRDPADEVRLPTRTEPTPAPPAPVAAAVKPTTTTTAPTSTKAAPIPEPAPTPPTATEPPVETAPKATKAKAPTKTAKGATKTGAKAKKAEPAAPAVRVAGESTPNPNAMKFTCSVKIVPKGSLSYNNAAVAGAHPLGQALFAIGGVRAVFAVNDFVTVTKEDHATWAVLEPQVEQAIATVLAEQAPA